MSRPRPAPLEATAHVTFDCDALDVGAAADGTGDGWHGVWVTASPGDGRIRADEPTLTVT